MFFKRASEARMYAKLETIKTNRIHIVKACKKYLCLPKCTLGKDYITGYTIILKTK